ncbi:hypothetical protein SEUCBS140593_010488 [Sporothrix eucalyptigena]|uniref:Ser arg-related nuclear matrix protein n=1 Tax=Sporothrix eucalyptigena TaxID=1812306 RepID=A0ABP0D336_9PEZI
MAGRYRNDDYNSSRPGYYSSSHSDYYRHHDRANSEHIPRNDYSTAPRSLHQSYGQNQPRRRNNPLGAFVEDERDALAREFNPTPLGLLAAAGDGPIVRGEIDQVPILIDVEENPERRFVLLPKQPGSDADSATTEKAPKRPSGSRHASGRPLHASNASTVSVDSDATHTTRHTAGVPSTITATASTITSTASTITPTGSPTTPTGPSGASLGNGRTSSGTDRASEYEANTCRKFTVPRIESESSGTGSALSEPSTIDSDGDTAVTTPPPPRRRRSSLSGTATAALSAAAAAATIATASAPSKTTTPEIKRRKSRLDLPRIDTDMPNDDRAPNSSTGRPRSSTHSEHRPRDRHHEGRDSRDSRDRDNRDRRDVRDNDFLSPTFTKHSTNGRDRAYFDHDRSHGSGGLADSARARSGDDRRTHERAERNSASFDASIKRRSTSFSETDRTERLSRQPSYKRTSRDEAAGPRTRPKSPSPPPKPHNSPSPPSRPEKRPSSPPRNRDRERDRERDWQRERDKERERERERAREREERDRREERERREERGEDRVKDVMRERQRELERERDRDKDRRIQEQERDRQKLTRRESIQKKRRDSVVRDDAYSSDERTKKTSANTPLRRQNSERRRPPPPHKDDESVVSKASSNPDSRRPASINDPGTSTNGRYRSGGTTPLATPKQSQANFPFMAGSPPKELFEGPRPASPPKQYRDDGRRREDRRPGSSPSPPSSPEGRLRITRDSDRPRGPRPRAPHHPNVIHNPTNPSASMPNLQPAPRASTMPIPIPIPIPIPAHGGDSRGRDWDEPSRHDRRRSPVDNLRGSRASLSNPARISGVFANSPNTSQPYRQPAFFINIPGVGPGDNSPATDLHIDVGGDPARERLPERPPPVNSRPNPPSSDMQVVPSYRRFAEDIYNGRIPGPPQCPRINFSTKYRDWLTLTPYKDFLICPTCYETQFAHTVYRNEFVPATDIDPKIKTNCIYGAMPWYQVAYFYTRANKRPNLALLRTMFNRDEELRLPCSGAMRVPGRWFTVQDPVTARPVSRFTTCEQCMTAINVLFPRLEGLLQDNNPSQLDTTNICSLYHLPERKRLWKYIDVLESVHNEAVDTNLPVDVDNFINKIMDVSRYDECKRDIPVRGRKWYWMRTIPDFIVCQECFDEAVYPVVNTYRGVAGDFFKEPKELTLAACHLYSARMRDIFLRACENNDKDYLEQKLQERNDVAADITNRIKRLPDVSTSGDIEQAKLMAEWKKWE